MTNTTIKPDFIGIGPEKTGTSLLYMLLNENIQISMPPCKEIRYWNEGNLIPLHNLRAFLTSPHWHYRNLREILKKNLSLSIRNFVYLRKNPTSNLLWSLRYCIGKRSSTWYSSLFPREGKVSGDISPLYYHIPEIRIRECSKHNPDMKIIIFIRNPIDRVWSKARMNLLKHKGRDAVDFDTNEFRGFCQHVYSNWRPYMVGIRIWQLNFPNVHIAIYDELLIDSKEWYRKICEFLGVEMNISIGLKRWVNQGLDFEIPENCERILFQQYGNELKQVGELYSLPSWLEKYEKLATRFGENVR
jgi:hypothetical protein